MNWDISFLMRRVLHLELCKYSGFQAFYIYDSANYLYAAISLKWKVQSASLQCIVQTACIQLSYLILKSKVLYLKVESKLLVYSYIP